MSLKMLQVVLAVITIKIKQRVTMFNSQMKSVPVKTVKVLMNANLY